MKRSMVYTSLVGVVALSFVHGQDAGVDNVDTGAVNPTTAVTDTNANAKGAVEEQKNAVPDELRNFSLKEPIINCNGDPVCIGQRTGLEPMRVELIISRCQQETRKGLNTGDFAECFINQQSTMGGMPGYNGQYPQGNYGGGYNGQYPLGQNNPPPSTNTGPYSSINPGYSSVYNSRNNGGSMQTGSSYTGGRYTGDANTRPSLSVAMVAVVGAFTLGGTLLQL